MIYVNSDGKVFKEPLAMPNGAVCYNPTPAMLAEAGYFPTPPEPAPVSSGGSVKIRDFRKVKAAFWRYVDEAAAALSAATGQTFTRADFPAGAYSPELLAWCAEHGMSEAQTGALAVKFCGIAADLARLRRNWNELFDEVAE